MDEIKNTTAAAKNASELANNVYTDIRPIIQPVAKSIGRVIEFMGCVTLPFQYWSEMAKINYVKRIEEYKKKVESIKEEDRCEVHPEIGVPIMQALPYTTNDDIAEMFTNLLASASDIRLSGSAHPAFVEYIKQMSPDEAMIVKHLKGLEVIPYISLRIYLDAPNKGFITIAEKVVNLDHELQLIYPENVKVDISNLLSLGIIADAMSLHLVDDNIYQKIIQDQGLDELKAENEKNPDVKSVNYSKGYYKVTEIGKLFIKACCR